MRDLMKERVIRCNTQHPDSGNLIDMPFTEIFFVLFSCHVWALVISNLLGKLT